MAKQREKGIKLLAWTSLGIAYIGGAAITGTWLGRAIANIVGVFPGWVGIVVVIAAAIATAIDLFVDGTPNYPALYTVIVVPSIASSIPGRLGETIQDLSVATITQINADLESWLGTSSALGLGIACVVAALLMARRVITKTR